ncbi:hypothetical protein TSUD_27910 [Trifolium subterraneum]|uniref:Uncharacterized protein n=1 Tax=Trifolium subterraneum TaxID=3900 RepID=A0A2Z6PEZ3_TRISU|nr:hypothetical protein TSUD_27910 [Trifolium subterraneum]
MAQDAPSKGSSGDKDVCTSFVQLVQYSNLKAFQTLFERFTLPKGSSSVRMQDLKERILKFWKTNEQWTFAWSADVNPYTAQPTNAQTWIRIHGLAREYWRPQILFEIAGALGSPLALDEATKKRTFGQFARILIDVDLSSNLHERILVERNDFDFYTPRATKNSTTVNKLKVRQNTLNVEKHPTSNVCVPNTSSSNGMASPIVGDDMNLANEDFCEELHEEEEVVVDSIPLENQDRSIVVPDSNLSNFNANVIHDMQVLGILSAPTAAQQTMDFLSNSWANMTQTKEVVDSVGNTNQQFQLVVPKIERTRPSRNKPKLVKGSRLVLSIDSHLVIQIRTSDSDFKLQIRTSDFIFRLQIVSIPSSDSDSEYSPTGFRCEYSLIGFRFLDCEYSPTGFRC